jgi:hypothetical protein
MKITTKYKNGDPFMGNRSTQFMGISLLMEAGFFNLTRHMAWGEPHPDTRINLFILKTQEELRDRLLQSADAVGLSKGEAGAEWAEIVKIGTAKATEYIKAKTSAGKSNDCPLTLTEHGELVSSAFKVAFREASGIVNEREAFEDSWTVQPSFDLSPPKERRIYIRHDHPSTDTYKIGMTTRPGIGSKSRDSEYNTHSAESVIIAEYTESGILNEKNLHSYFKPKWLKLEFFQLSADDLEIATDPKKMMQALMSAGFTN